MSLFNHSTSASVGMLETRPLLEASSSTLPTCRYIGRQLTMRGVSKVLTVAPRRGPTTHAGFGDLGHSFLTWGLSRSCSHAAHGNEQMPRASLCLSPWPGSGGRNATNRGMDPVSTKPALRHVDRTPLPNSEWPGRAAPDQH